MSGDERTQEARSELWVVWGPIEKDGRRYPEHCAGWREACHEHINDAINEHHLEEARQWTVVQHSSDAAAIIERQAAEIARLQFHVEEATRMHFAAVDARKAAEAEVARLKQQAKDWQSCAGCVGTFCKADALLARAEAAEAEVARLEESRNDQARFKLAAIDRADAAEAEARQLREQLAACKRDADDRDNALFQVLYTNVRGSHCGVDFDLDRCNVCGGVDTHMDGCIVQCIENAAMSAKGHG